MYRKTNECLVVSLIWHIFSMPLLPPKWLWIGSEWWCPRSGLCSHFHSFPLLHCHSSLNPVIKVEGSLVQLGSQVVGLTSLFELDSCLGLLGKICAFMDVLFISIFQFYALKISLICLDTYTWELQGKYTYHFYISQRKDHMNP